MPGPPGPEAETPLPLYRSTEMCRAAVIVGVGAEHVQVDFPRLGDDLPIVKPAPLGGRAPAVGDVFIEDRVGVQVLPQDEFNRRYRPAASEAPRESLPIKASYARVAYEAARANQGGKGQPWESAPEPAKQAAVALASHLLDEPYTTDAQAHDVWRAAFGAEATGDAAVLWPQLSPERQRGLKVFRAVIGALK